MANFIDEVFGLGEDERHEDGSVTSRYSDGESVTKNADGTERERSYDTCDVFGNSIRVTRDGDGNIINRQDRE
jgi:hypothetical protein